MKRELKIGDSQIITIADNGTVIVPREVRMNISEIAELFGIFYQTVKRCVRDIEKSGIANGDYSMSCTCDGSKVYPDYHGLEIIIALSFQVKSAKARIFQEWLIRRISMQPIVVELTDNIPSTDKCLWN
ncbi:MAG: helix-turn-helix domain-containing protein [Dysgonomonas mossii]|nr:helix-turn-helix domain-containing protein [Dysgonomonas mossii]